MSARHAVSERGTAESTVQEAEHDITVHRSLTIGQWLNLPTIPILGQLIQTVFFVLLVFGFFLWFASVPVTDQTIELWVGTKLEHLKILGLEVSYNAVVLKVTMIVAVFSGLSFVATTSSDDRHAIGFLEPMVLRLRKILLIRDISLHFQVWAPKRHWRAMNCGPHRRKKIVQSPLTLPIRRR